MGRIFATHSPFIATVLRHLHARSTQFFILGTGAIYILFLIAPLLGDSVIGRVETLGRRLARKKRAAALSVAAAAIVIRLLLLPFVPVPVPEVHDEFSYLLAADTFAHGRLTNPPHPLSVYFDTFHVNMHPMYMSMYPPVQGAMLAIGQLLGNPWIGVLLGIAAMCATIVWALQGWLPPTWAFLGGVLVFLQIGVSSYWINGYWGGAATAIGGALVLGAFPRVIHHRRPLDALILGLGVAILANSRPYEGAIFCLPVFAALLIWLWKRRPEWRSILLRAGVPIVAVLLACGAFMLNYNARLTGSALLMPEALNVRNNYSMPVTVFEKRRPPLHFENAQFDTFYNQWVPNNSWDGGFPNTIRHVLVGAASHAASLVMFFVWPAFVPLLVIVPWTLRDRRMRVITAQLVLSFGGFLTVAWFLPHYAAPLAVSLALLLTQTMRHIRSGALGSRIGIGVSRAAVLSAFLFAPFHYYYVNLHPGMQNRARTAHQLELAPGRDLVIVRYSSEHDVQAEWVYNAADIDRSKIVWAREIPGVSMAPLLNYFHDRRVWLVEPDQIDPKLLPYSASQ